MVRTTQRAGGATGCAVRRAAFGWWRWSGSRAARSRSSHASSDAAVATTSVRPPPHASSRTSAAMTPIASTRADATSRPRARRRLVGRRLALLRPLERARLLRAQRRRAVRRRVEVEARELPQRQPRRRALVALGRRDLAGRVELAGRRDLAGAAVPGRLHRARHRRRRDARRRELRQRARPRPRARHWRRRDAREHADRRLPHRARHRRATETLDGDAGSGRGVRSAGGSGPGFGGPAPSSNWETMLRLVELRRGERRSRRVEN